MSAAREMPSARSRRHRAFIAVACAGTVLAMTGLAFASVPLYKLFCEATGLGGTTRKAAASAGQVLDQMVNVRFDSNVAPGAGLRFRPLQGQLAVRLGESGLAFYEVTNTGDAPQTFVASYNVAPHLAGSFFVKLECFCFRDQILQPGETLKLPVVFYVDPAMAEDIQGKHLSEITLSYTFFRAPENQG